MDQRALIEVSAALGKRRQGQHRGRRIAARVGDQIGGPDPLDMDFVRRTRDFLERHQVAMYSEHPALAAAFIRHYPGADGPNGQQLNALTSKFLHLISQLVLDQQARGEVGADVEPLVAAHNIFSLYFGALVAWMTGFMSLEDALDPGLRQALALQIRGFRP